MSKAKKQSWTSLLDDAEAMKAIELLKRKGCSADVVAREMLRLDAIEASKRGSK